MALINSDVIPASATGGYTIDQSLRFNDDDSAYLEWTPSAEGNRRTWTLSLWFKGYWTGGNNRIFGSHIDANNLFGCFINSSGELGVWSNISGATSLRWNSNALLRDPSAWYHLVFVLDTTQATSTNRFKVYLNGEQLTTSSYTAPSQNSQERWNSTTAMWIGKSQYAGNLDGYLAEVNFIDGQALDPTYFGETGDYGEWKPIAYTGTYGTNGFYLPFKQDYQVEGFSTVTWSGSGSSEYIGGVGFQPDVVWMKTRNNTYDHWIHDSVRGVGKLLTVNSTGAESTSFPNILSSFDNDGFTSDGYSPISASSTYVAWSWDMGGSNATNTDGSITSTVRANPTYGQSIVSYTGTGSNATVGHGLSSAPEVVIVKSRNQAYGWYTYHTSLGATKYVTLNNNGAEDTVSSVWNNTAPTTSVFSIGTNAVVNTNTQDYIAYCFHSVSGYSKFGSYTGTGSSGNSVTTGFEPAWVMIKKSNNTGDWTIHDSTRGGDLRLYANEFDVEGSGYAVGFNDTGFTLDNTATNWNANGDTYIYMAFADTREFAYWLDQSGNNNDWTSNNLTESDISVDSPTNNFATLNSIDPSFNSTLSEGNLKNAYSASPAQRRTTIGLNSGKWYAECEITGSGSVGVTYNNYPTGSNYFGGTTGDLSYVSNGNLYRDLTGSVVSYGASYTTGDIIGIALNLDSGTLTFYKNNTSQGNIDISSVVDGRDWWFGCGNDVSGTIQIMNFGQDSSFAGNKTAQGNTDGNSIGDFYYTPPSGYLALCTQNLPDPTVIPSEHFNTVLYTGNGGTNAITGVGFQPSLVWAKCRSAVKHHGLYDAVRGVTKRLMSSLTSVEDTYSGVDSFDSDGFTLGSFAGQNENGSTFVAWNWKANGSGSSNTDGSITSTVSANQDAGFSIVSYTGASGNNTIGHGLSSTPEMIIVKNRDSIQEWVVYHASNTSAPETDYLRLDSTNATADYGFWNDTAPTSTVFTVGDLQPVNSGHGNNYIAYCFHSVDGFSKVGSYTGNGSSDGTFVYTGFRPAFIMVKSTTSAHDWVMEDNTRSIYNPVNEYVIANGSQTESSDLYNHTDFLSNGFKLRDTQNGMNGSNTYIYIAFAEVPAKFSNGR